MNTTRAAVLSLLLFAAACDSGAGLDDGADLAAVPHVDASAQADLFPPECGSDKDCPGAQLCEHGACVDPPPDMDAADLTMAPHCSGDDECKGGRLCIDGACTTPPPPPDLSPPLDEAAADLASAPDMSKAAPDLAPACQMKLESFCYDDGGAHPMCFALAGVPGDGGACVPLDDPGKIACGANSCAGCPKSWTITAPVNGACP